MIFTIRLQACNILILQYINLQHAITVLILQCMQESIYLRFLINTETLTVERCVHYVSMTDERTLKPLTELKTDELLQPLTERRRANGPAGLM